VERDHHALVIGSGHAGVKHAEALDELGIAFTGPLSARRVMEDPRALEDPAVDVVHVCAANDLHVALAGRALRAGKDVVCEKPLAVDVRGAEELVALAGKSGRLAVLAYNYRFHPMVVELAARVAFLGPLHTARGSFLQDWLLLASDANWRIDEARGGASRAIADIGAHWLDLAELVSGKRIVGVAAQLGRLHGRGTEDHAGLLLGFSDGMTGTLMLSQAAAGHRNDMELSLDGATGSATWRHERPTSCGWARAAEMPSWSVAMTICSRPPHAPSRRCPPGRTKRVATSSPRCMRGCPVTSASLRRRSRHSMTGCGTRASPQPRSRARRARSG